LFSILIFSAALLGAPFFARAEDFNWTNLGTSSSAGGYNFVTPVKNQDGSGMCWAFAATGMLEAKYKITRDDPIYDIDLSEQQLADAGIGDYTNGGNSDNCTGYFASTGLVTETVLPFQWSYVSPWPGWPLTSDQLSQTCKISSSRNWIYESTAQIKADLKNYGPIAVAIQVANDWYNPSPGSYSGGHEVVITGYHDNVGSESAPGGGYFIVKNSWSSTWNGNGYAEIAYATLSNNRDLCMITSGAYFTNPMQTVTWDTSTSPGYQPGAGSWSTTSNAGYGWSADGTTLSAWRNGEDAAVFDGGGNAYTVNVDYDVSAHSVTFNSGASGYTLNGGTLTVTTGGMTFNESVTLNTGLIVGGDQTWTIAGGKTLTVNANVNTHISALTINCAGDTIIKGAIRDVRGDTRWNGLLTSSSGSLTKSGTGTLTLCGNNTYTGNTAITAGTIKLGATPAGLSEGRIDAYFDTTNSNPAASIQLSTRMANTALSSTETAKTYVYTGYINNSGGSSVTWKFAENYDDALRLYIDGAQVLNDTQWNVQTTGNYTLTPGLHSFELRLGDNGAPNGPNGAGVNGTGLGVAVDENDGLGYRALTDPGDGSLFRLSNTDGGSMSPASTIVMSSNTTLDLNNYSTTVGALANASGTPTGHQVLIGSAMLSIGGNNSSNLFSGVISGTGSLIKIGTGVQALTGANTYSGGTTFNGGYLSVLSLANLGSGALTFNGGGIQFRTSFDPTVRSMTINSGGASFDTNSYTVTFYNALSGAGGITKAGSGTLVYQVANTYSGNTAITGGTLKAGATNVIPSGSGCGNVSVAYGAILDLNGYSQTINGLAGLGTVDNGSGSSSYTISVGGNDADSQFYGNIKNTYGKVSLNKIGTGTLTISSAANTYTGSTLITSGTLKLGATAAGLYEGMLSSYFDISSANPKTAVQLTTVEANTSFGANQTWVYSGYIYNSGNSSVTWTFAENFDDAARLLIDGAQILYSTNWSDQTTGTRTLTPGLHSFELRVGGDGTPNGPNGTGVSSTGLGVAYSTDGGTTYRALTDPGDGSLFRLSSSLNGSLPSTSAVVMSSNTIFDLNNYSTTIGSLADADGNPTGHRVLLGSGTLTLGGNSTSTTFSGVISGSGSLNKTGYGTLTLQGQNTYAGSTSINYGAIKIGTDNVLPGGAGKGNVSIASGATLDLGGFSQTINGLSGSGTVDNTIGGDSVLTLGANDAGSTFSGIIKNTAGSLSLIKTGTGMIILSGSNSYTGTISVAGGVLEAANASALGSAAGGTSVENGASLRITQSLNIANESLSLKGTGGGSGALHVGPGAVVNYGGAINLADNASINVDTNSTLNLTNSSGINGSNKDVTFVTAAGANAVLSGGLDLGDGDLNKNGSGSLVINGNILSVVTATIADGSLQVNSLSASIDDITGNGDLVVGDGSTAALLTTGSITVDALTIAAGAIVTISPIPGGPLSGSLQPVPEPSTALLLIIAGTIMFVARRKIAQR
jgi:autotransporter-associated beta strand protein